MQQEKPSLSRTVCSIYRVKRLFHETKVNVGQVLELLYIRKQSQNTAQYCSWRFNGHLQHTNRKPRSSAARCYLVLRDWTKPKCSEKSHNNRTLNRSRNVYENQNNKTAYLWGLLISLNTVTEFLVCTSTWDSEFVCKTVPERQRIVVSARLALPHQITALLTQQEQSFSFWAGQCTMVPSETQMGHC